MDLDVLHWVGNQDSLTKPQNLSYTQTLAFNAYMCVHKQRWAWVEVCKWVRGQERRKNVQEGWQQHWCDMQKGGRRAQGWAGRERG